MEKRDKAVTVLFQPSQIKLIDKERIKEEPPITRQEVIRRLVDGLPKYSRESA